MILYEFLAQYHDIKRDYHEISRLAFSSRVELAQFPVTARGCSGVREADLRARQREGTGGSYTIQLTTFLQA